MTRRAACLLACGLSLSAPTVCAQTIDGTAEWTAARNTSSSDSQSNSNNSFWQSYTVGFSSALWDPRIFKYNTEAQFRTNNLSARGTEQPDQQGRQSDVGFKLGASLFPASAFPFFVQASRVNSTSSGDLSPSNAIRGAFVSPVGTQPLDFDTRTDLINLGGQLNLRTLPRLQIGYRRGTSVVTGGPYKSQQNDEDLSAGLTKETTRVRHSLRFQRSSFANYFPQAFSQRLNNLDYDFSALLVDHVRLTAHGGQRGTFSQSEMQAPALDAAAAPYSPPVSEGRASARYASAGIDYEPTVRLALRFYGTVDQQTAADITTNARLATFSAHYEVVRGLSLNASGTAGDRGEVVNHLPLTVATRSGVAGVTYRAGPRWLEGSVTATRGMGLSATPDGQIGSSQSWSREASLSSTVRWLGLGVGYERARNRDELLSFGNYDSERIRGSVQAQASRASVTLATDQVRLQRGAAALLVRNLERTFSGSASYRFWRQNMATASAGGFSNDYQGAGGSGRDQTLFWTAGAQLTPWPLVRASVWIRREIATATSTKFDQNGLSAFGRVEYRLRTINLGVEYRINNSRVQYAAMPNPDAFRGRQVRISLSRRFGFNL